MMKGMKDGRRNWNHVTTMWDSRGRDSIRPPVRKKRELPLESQCG